MASPEFEVGELVTFHQYESKIEAKVVEVINTGKDQFGRPDNRVFYRLTGAGETPLATRTTGKSIEESACLLYTSPSPRD